MIEENFMTCFTVWKMLFYTVKPISEILLIVYTYFRVL